MHGRLGMMMAAVMRMRLRQYRLREQRRGGGGKCHTARDMQHELTPSGADLTYASCRGGDSKQTPRGYAWPVSSARNDKATRVCQIALRLRLPARRESGGKP